MANHNCLYAVYSNLQLNVDLYVIIWRVLITEILNYHWLYILHN